MSAWVTDLCGTVVREDTTVGLVRRHLRRRRLHLSRLAMLLSRLRPGQLLWGVAERLSGRHLFKHALVALLRGETMASLKETAEAYADELLADLRVASVTHVLAQRSAAHPLVVASASLSPIVAAVAQRLGAERHVASQLGVVNGVLTGRYAEDVTGAKPQALAATGVSSWAVALSDNLTDRALLEAAEARYVVLWRESDRARWAGLAATYLQGA